MYVWRLIYASYKISAQLNPSSPLKTENSYKRTSQIYEKTPLLCKEKLHDQFDQSNTTKYNYEYSSLYVISQNLSIQKY